MSLTCNALCNLSPARKVCAQVGGAWKTGRVGIVFWQHVATARKQGCQSKCNRGMQADCYQAWELAQIRDVLLHQRG
jgi:hypothetical protein